MWVKMNSQVLCLRAVTHTGLLLIKGPAIENYVEKGTRAQSWKVGLDESRLTEPGYVAKGPSAPELPSPVGTEC